MLIYIKYMAENNFLNEYIGGVIKLQRTKKDLTQSKLGDLLGVSFQQVQKYENGKNQTPIEKLYQMVKIFECGISDFFPNSLQKKKSSLKAAEAKNDTFFNEEDADSIELVILRKLINEIPKESRKQYIKAAKALATSFKKEAIK